MKSTIFFLTLFILTQYGNAQLNDYKYIIIPKKLKEFNKENEHLTSTLLRHLFSEQGFNTVYDDALPMDLKANGCLGLRAELKDNSSLFVTKVKIQLYNCNGGIVMESKEGRSKSKEYKQAYAEAIRDAFTTFNNVPYKYSGKPSNDQVTVSMENDIKRLPKNQPDKTVVRQDTGKEEQMFKKVEIEQSELRKSEASIENARERVIANEATQNARTPSKTTPVVTQSKSGGSMLYAQKTNSGYQVVDATPKVVMQLYTTSKSDVFLCKTDEYQGVVYKENGNWYVEHHNGETLEKEKVNLKF